MLKSEAGKAVKIKMMRFLLGGFKSPLTPLLHDGDNDVVFWTRHQMLFLNTVLLWKRHQMLESCSIRGFSLCLTILDGTGPRVGDTSGRCSRRV